MLLQATRGVYVPSPLLLRKNWRSSTLETLNILSNLSPSYSTLSGHVIFILLIYLVYISFQKEFQVENMEKTLHPNAMPKHGRGFSKLYTSLSTILHYTTPNLQNNSIKKKSTVKEKKKVRFLGTWCPCKATLLGAKKTLFYLI